MGKGSHGAAMGYESTEHFPGRVLVVLLWDQGQKPQEEAGGQEQCILAELRFSLGVSALL